MKKLSEKLTGYVIRTGDVSEEKYEIYQYGFEIGLEMLSCFFISLIIAVYLHMVLEFVVSTAIFICLRTYVGGLHLDSFLACFICSITVQTMILLVNGWMQLPLLFSWVFIIVCSAITLSLTPVGNINHELDKAEMKHCQRVTLKILMGIFAFSSLCTAFQNQKYVSLVALVMLVVLCAQCLGIVKHKHDLKKGSVE